MDQLNHKQLTKLTNESIPGYVFGMALLRLRFDEYNFPIAP